MACWLPGSEGGGVADVLFGAAPFSGKLSFTWPKSAQHGRYEKRRANPLFACGFGLETSARPEALPDVQ